jgi:hypothetical protein
LGAKYIHRTDSEEQLCQNEAIAEYRDYCMYSRIIGGISKQLQVKCDLKYRYEDDHTMGNIMRTRHSPLASPASTVAHQIHQGLPMFMLHPKTSPNYTNDWEPSFVDIEQDSRLEQEEMFVLDM